MHDARQNDSLEVFPDVHKGLWLFWRMTWQSPKDRARFGLWCDNPVTDACSVICNPIYHFVKLAPESLRWNITKGCERIARAHDFADKRSCVAAARPPLHQARPIPRERTRPPKG